MENKIFRLYLKDLVTIIKEDAIKAKEASSKTPNDFNQGRLMAYYEFISLMRQQGEAFSIDLRELNLHDFDEEKELLF